MEMSDPDALNEPKSLDKTSPVARVRWWTFFVLIVAGIVVSGLYWMMNGDIWWHLKAGELIRKTGSIPTHNLFTYTNPDSEWIDLHWLFQLGASVVYDTFGTAGLVLTKAILGGTVFAILLGITRDSIPGWLMAVSWLPFVFIYGGRFHVRPEMLSHLYIALTLVILSLHRKGRTGWIWALIPLQILWVNCQGLFILQHCLVGAYAIDWSFNNGSRFLSQSARKVWLVLFAICIASLCNPYGLEGALFPLELLGKMGGEHRELYNLLAGETVGMSSFIERYGFGALLESSTPRWIMIMTPLVIGSVCFASYLDKQLKIYQVILMLGFGYLTWNMNRNASLYSLVWGFVFVESLGVIWKSRSRKSNSEQSDAMTLGGVAQGIFALFLVLHLASGVLGIVQEEERTGDFALSRKAGVGEHPWYQHEAAKFIANLPVQANVFASYHGTGFAGLVVYHGFDGKSPNGKRVFADARLEANRVEVLQEFSKWLDQAQENLATAERTLLKYSDTLPILAVGTSDLLRRPRLLEALIAEERWRSVYLSDSPTTGTGVVVFVPDYLARELELEVISLAPLRRSW